jgi:L-alanine-DL-glutamate epimerase-like enolase superfamily enzyme
MGFYRGGPVIMSALSGIDIALRDLKGAYSEPARVSWSQCRS